MIYFLGVVPGQYMASWPAYIVGDDPQALAFTVAVGDRQLACWLRTTSLTRLAER